MFKVNNENTRNVTDIFLVSLFVNLCEHIVNIFHTFIYCFYCWFWTSKYYLGSAQISWIKFVDFTSVILRDSLQISPLILSEFKRMN